MHCGLWVHCGFTVGLLWVHCGLFSADKPGEITRSSTMDNGGSRHGVVEATINAPLTPEPVSAVPRALGW